MLAVLARGNYFSAGRYSNQSKSAGRVLFWPLPVAYRPTNTPVNPPAFSEDKFTQLRDTLQSASGKYVSTGKVSLSNNQGYAVYRIICKYEQEDVVITVVFKIDGKQIEGLFFDSPNLRTATQQ